MSRPLQVYEEGIREPTTFLRLVPHGIDGSISLVSVDRNGKRVPGGSLMVFTEYGYQVCSMVGHAAGVPLTSDCKWKEDDR